jgi:DNA-binding MarR family transcriptional regulator
LARSTDAAAYEKEFPGSRYLAMRAIRQLQVVGVKVDGLISGLARRFGLSHAALNALAVIEGAGGPIPTGEVTAKMHITTATMTSVLDTLERGGFIVRTADPTDRRRVLVDVTDAAREVLDQLLPLVAQTTTLVAAAIDDTEIEQLLHSLGVVLEGIASVPDELPRPASRRRTPRSPRH